MSVAVKTDNADLNQRLRHDDRRRSYRQFRCNPATCQSLELRRLQSRADAARRREARLSEEIAGWAANALFLIADVPNRYAKLPGEGFEKLRVNLRNTFCGNCFG
jgi:hypothetical protein